MALFEMDAIFPATIRRDQSETKQWEVRMRKDHINSSKRHSRSGNLSIVSGMRVSFAAKIVG